MQTLALKTAAAQIEIVVVVGSDISVHPLPQTGDVTFGRAKDCDVRLNHPSISRRHAVLHCGPPMWIEDLGSANGTAVVPPGSLSETAGTDSTRRASGDSFGVDIGDTLVLGVVTCTVRMRPPETSQSGIRPILANSTSDIIVQDPAMQALYEQARCAAQSSLSILLLGETGVGKEVLAREIHRASPRCNGPFVALHCGAISDSLLEGELFGHERGAFTGASQSKAGLIEAAEGGTLLLDEVGEMGALAQMKLLRVLEERAVMRVGARTTRPVNVRFISATNRDLEAEVTCKTFREDLFYRLNGIALTIPPLRQRQNEIASLAASFLDGSRMSSGAASATISREALEVLLQYSWPGNVRELKNAMQRAAVLAHGGEVRIEHLPPKIAMYTNPSRASAKNISTENQGVFEVRSADDLRIVTETMERRRIMDALEQCGGSQTRAAEALGISRRTLVNRLEDYGLPRPRKKA